MRELVENHLNIFDIEGIAFERRREIVRHFDSFLDFFFE